MTNYPRGRLFSAGGANYPRGRLSPRGRLAAQQLRDRKDAVVSAGADVMKKLLVRQRIELGIVQVKVSCLEGADCLEEALFQRPADTHDFTGSLHLCGERIVRVRELVKREARHFRDDIIQRRFE